MSVAHHQHAESESTATSGARTRLAKRLFVAAAFVSFLFSVSLWFGGYRDEGLFVGLWVPSILSFGTLVFAGQKGH